MSERQLTDTMIQSFIDKLNSNLSVLNIAKHNKTWLRLFLEESLLKYRDTLGESASFSYTIKKRFSNFLVEVFVDGDPIDVLHPEGQNGEGSAILDNLFNSSDGQILYKYQNGRNIISVSMPIESRISKLPGSPSLYAIILAVIVGLLMKLLPQDTTAMLVESYISPVYSTLMNALKGLMEPVIFISLVIGICALDDLKTLSTIGKKTLLSFLGLSTVMFAVTVITCIFVFPSKGEAALGFNPAEILKLLLDSIPSSIIKPFYDGNMIQIVVLGFVSGVVILILGEKVSTIKKFVLEFKFFFFSILEMFVKLLPIVVFLSVVKVILTISISDSATVWKIIAADQLLVVFIAFASLLFTSAKTKTPLGILIKKVTPLFNVSLTTGSSTATIPEFYKRLPTSFGIDEKYSNYWIPLSNSFFSPSTIIALIVYAFFSAQMQGIGHSVGWLITLYIMIIQIGMATPRIPGGIIASCSILFAQLGLTTDQLGIIMAANVLILYLDTAVAAVTRCCCAINVAVKQGYIDLDKLRDPKLM